MSHTMLITAIHGLQWKIGLTAEDLATLEDNGWSLENDLPGFLGLFIYTSGGEFGSKGRQGLFPEIKSFCIEDGNGGTSAHAYKDAEHLLDCLRKTIHDRSGLKTREADLLPSGAGSLESLILRMGWDPAGEKIVLASGYKLKEGGGYFVDVAGIRKHLEKHPGSTVIVHRATFRGKADLSLDDVRRMGCTFDDDRFEPDDDQEFLRIAYRCR